MNYRLFWVKHCTYNDNPVNLKTTFVQQSCCKTKYTTFSKTSIFVGYKNTAINRKLISFTSSLHIVISHLIQIESLILLAALRRSVLRVGEGPSLRHCAGQHSFIRRIIARWRAVGDTVYNVTDPRFEPQISCSTDRCDFIKIWLLKQNLCSYKLTYYLTNNGYCGLYLQYFIVLLLCKKV